MNSITTAQFINHASILIEHGEISLLSDPWYQGDAFHKGWSLLHELKDNEIIDLLNKVTHLWVSHEHPDHFSIMFFKKFGALLREKNIEILFQDTADKRVENFLVNNSLKTTIIKFNEWIDLSSDFKILCFKDGFYDTGLAIKTSDKSILNFNDCEINDNARCEEVFQLTGECDILFTQFSYAAWKGGVDNLEWRQLAAKEKIETMQLQASYFNPSIIVPFASYIYFSNQENFYLNDASNKPTDVIQAFVDHTSKVQIMQPFDTLKDVSSCIENEQAIKFWSNVIAKIDENELQKYDRVPISRIQESFEIYVKRVFDNNSKWFMRTIRFFSPISAFKPIIIQISDLDITVKLDIFSKRLEDSTIIADVKMSSESLNFILTNTFGFDTLTVNGCFEEVAEGGFSQVAKTLAIENLNNMGIAFRPNIIVNPGIIKLFLTRLWKISKKLNFTKAASS